jgi:hypothetical protein
LFDGNFNHFILTLLLVLTKKHKEVSLIEGRGNEYCEEEEERE